MSAPAGTTHDRHLSRIARAGSINTLGAVAGAVCTVAFTWVVAHGTDQTDAGNLFAVTSAFLLAVAVAELGSDVSLARFLPRFTQEGRTRAAAVALTAAVASTALAGAVLAVLFVLFRDPVARTFGGDPAAVADALLLLAVVIPLAALMNTLLSATRGLRSVRPTVIVDQLGRNGGQLLLVGAVIVAGGGLALMTSAWAVPYVLGVVVAARLLRSRWRRLPAAADPGLPPRLVVAEYGRFAWPRAVARVSQMLMQRADIVLVAALRSPREAAVYTVATRFLVAGQVVVQAVQQVLGPQLSALLAAGDRPAATKVLQTTASWVISLTWPLYLLSVALAVPMLRIFGGDDYTWGTGVVLIMALAYMLSSAFGPLDVTLLMLGRSGLSLAISLTALTVNLVLNLLLVPRLGIEGAALAWAAAIVVRNALGLRAVRADLRAVPFTRMAALAGTLAVVTLGVLPIGARYLAGEGAVLYAVTAACVVAYTAGVWLLRGPLGLDVFAGALRRRRTAA